jgi:maleate isomerase
MHALPEIRLDPQRPALDPRPMEKRVGLIILATDHTTEVDFQRVVAGPNIGVYVSRIAYANPTTPENLRGMLPDLASGAGLILPGETLDAVVYSCSSASVIIGDAEIEAAIRRAKPGVPVVTPTLAALRGLTALETRKISILTPYTVETSRPMAAYFAGHGFEIASVLCLGFEDDREMARIAPDTLVDIARGAIAPDADALFISCTALRSAIAAYAIEEAIVRPVVTSNQATAWNCLRLCGDHKPRPEFGRLMTLPLAAGRAAS